MFASLAAQTHTVLDRRISAGDALDVVRDLTQTLCARALELSAHSPAALVDRVPDFATAKLACTRLRHALQSGYRLPDGDALSLRHLLHWRLRLLDQLRFELGDDGYDAARLDEAAQQLWHWLEGDRGPLFTR